MVRNCPRIRACLRLAVRAPGSSVSSPPRLLGSWPGRSVPWRCSAVDASSSIRWSCAERPHGTASELRGTSVYRLPSCAPRRVSSIRLLVSFAPKTLATLLVLLLLLLLLSSCPPTTPDFPKSLRLDRIGGGTLSARKRRNEGTFLDRGSSRRSVSSNRADGRARHARSPCLNPLHSSQIARSDLETKLFRTHPERT